MTLSPEELSWVNRADQYQPLVRTRRRAKWLWAAGRVKRVTCARCNLPQARTAIRLPSGTRAVMCERCLPLYRPRAYIPWWTEAAACEDGDVGERPSIFARTYCIRCPVTEHCLRLAMEAEATPIHRRMGKRTGARHGRTNRRFHVYGGLTPEERESCGTVEVALPFAREKLFTLAMREVS